MTPDLIMLPFFSFVFDRIKRALTFSLQQLQPCLLSRARTERLHQLSC